MQGIYNFFSDCPTIIQAAAFTTPIVSSALLALHSSLQDEYNTQHSDAKKALEFYENAPKFLKTAEAGSLIQAVGCVALFVLFGQPEIFLGLAFFAGLGFLCTKTIDFNDYEYKAVNLRANEALQANDQIIQALVHKTKLSIP